MRVPGIILMACFAISSCLFLSVLFNYIENRGDKIINEVEVVRPVDDHKTSSTGLVYRVHCAEGLKLIVTYGSMVIIGKCDE